MATLLRVLGLFLGVTAFAAILGGMTDDAPGLVVIGMMLAGVALYSFVGARREEGHRRRIEELLEHLSR